MWCVSHNMVRKCDEYHTILIEMWCVSHNGVSVENKKANEGY